MKNNWNKAPKGSYKRLLSKQLRVAVSDRTLSAWTGCSEGVLTDIWLSCAWLMKEEGLGKLELLWALSFLKVYATWEVLASAWQVARTTFTRKVVEVLFVLASTLDEVRHEF